MHRIPTAPRRSPEATSRRLLQSMGLIAGGGPRNLAVVLDRLGESDIASQADIGSRIDLWIGEEAGAVDWASFALGEERAAARWLHRAAIRLFPASRYTRRHSGRFSPVAVLARHWSPF